MKKYTAQDFANAKFAEHEDGQIAMRSHEQDVDEAWEVWTHTGYLLSRSDSHMAFAGWVPVPTKPTIEFTESQVEAIGRDAMNYFTPGGTWADWARAVFMSADFLVIPDPEPTNAEKLRSDLDEFGIGRGVSSKSLSEHLDGLGWTKAVDEAVVV